MPVAEILVLGGFLFIYSLEELTHLVLVCTGNLSSGHGHSHEEIEVPVEESIQVGPGHWSAGDSCKNTRLGPPPDSGPDTLPWVTSSPGPVIGAQIAG